MSWIPPLAGHSVDVCLRARLHGWLCVCARFLKKPILSASLSHLSAAGEQTSEEREREREGDKESETERERGRG